MQGIAVALNTVGWPRYRHDNRSSGWTNAVVADMPTLKWKIFVGGTAQLNTFAKGLAAGPVVNQNDVIFIGAGDADNKGGLFHAYDGNNMGAPIYTFNGPTGYGYTTPAVRSDGTAYYSTADGHAYAVTPTGTQQWSYMFGFQNDCSPIVTKDGYVIYGSDSGSLFALDPNGTLLWQSSISAGPGEVDSALAESCDGKIYAGGRNGWTTLDAQTGTTLWQVPAAGAYGALMGSPNVAQDGSMYGIDSGGQGMAIDKTGAVLWSKPLGAGGYSTDFARVGDRLFAVLDGNLHAYDIATGTELWSKGVGASSELYRHGGPVVDGHMRLYVNSTDGYLYAFDTSGNQLFKLAASGVSTPGENSFGTMAIGKDGTIYLPGNDGYLYAFQ
jgi:outer membrane protein assembly factor BamB